MDASGSDNRHFTSTSSPLLLRSIAAVSAMANHGTDTISSAGAAPDPSPYGVGVGVGHHDLGDIVQTHAHFKSFMPLEEKDKLLAMHQASQYNAGWYVLCVLVIYVGALLVLLKRKGYLNQQHYHYLCPSLCCLNLGASATGPSSTFGSQDGDEHELQLQLHRGPQSSQHSTSLTSITTNIITCPSPGPSTTPTARRHSSQLAVRVLEPREPLVGSGARRASFGRSNGTMSTNV